MNTSTFVPSHLLVWINIYPSPHSVHKDVVVLKLNGRIEFEICGFRKMPRNKFDVHRKMKGSPKTNSGDFEGKNTSKEISSTTNADGVQGSEWFSHHGNVSMG